MSAGYDIYCTTLSQEGRIYQLEYAEKAVESGSTSMGIVFSDGVILLSEKIRQSKAIVYGSNPTIYPIAPNIEIAICGLIPDGRNIISRAKLEASSYLKTYGIEISGQILTERLAIYVHAHTCHWSIRPFGCCVLIASYDKDNKYHLFMLENSGNFYEYFSCAHGKGRQFVKAEVEKDNFSIRNKNVKDGLDDALKIIIKSYEGEKETEYDVGIISVGSNNNHSVIDHNIIATEVNKLKDEVKNEKMDIEKEK
jgi:20S proteasome subunit alpha 7